MVVMAPENIEVPTELRQFKDSIVSKRIKAFYDEKKRLQNYIANDYPESMKASPEKIKKAESELKRMESLESRMKAYKFYGDMLYSVSVLNMAFNEYEPYSYIKGIEYYKKIKNIFENFVKTNELDNIMFLDDFVISKSENDFIMTSTVKLYSLKDKKVIVEKNIIGDTGSHGDMWTCTDPLSCLMVTTVKSAIENVAPEIGKRQR